MSPGHVLPGVCQGVAKCVSNFSRFPECRHDASRVQMLLVKDDRRRNFFRSLSSAHQTSAVQAYLNDLDIRVCDPKML